MTKSKNIRYYKPRPYAYPNAAEPGYFKGKLLDALTAIVTGMGSVTLLLYLLTF